MDTVFSILHRMIGPVMLAIALSVLYLSSDGVSAYMSAVKDNYADAHTYHTGKPESYELEKITGSYVMSVINNGAEVGSSICIETNTGSQNVIYVLTQETTGWSCRVSPVNYHVADGESYLTIEGLKVCSLDNVRAAIYPKAEYEVEYEYGETVGSTRTIYRCLF